MIKYSIVSFSLICVLRLTEKLDKIHTGLIVDENIRKETINFAAKELEKYFNANVHAIKNIEAPIQFKNDKINIKKWLIMRKKNRRYPTKRISI